jgi:hypothetical protein
MEKDKISCLNIINKYDKGAKGYPAIEGAKEKQLFLN